MPTAVLLAHVVAVRQVSPHVVRVTLGGPDIGQVSCGGDDQRIKLLFARPGQHTPVLPSADDWYGSFRALPDDVRPIMRTFTVRSQDPATGHLDVEFALHGDAGPASAWARSATEGSTLGLIAAGAVTALEFPAGIPYGWVAGEAAAVREVRRHLTAERGWNARDHYFAGYWRAGLSEDAA